MAFSLDTSDSARLQGGSGGSRTRGTVRLLTSRGNALSFDKVNREKEDSHRRSLSDFRTSKRLLAVTTYVQHRPCDIVLPLRLSLTLRRGEREGKKAVIAKRKGLRTIRDDQLEPDDLAKLTATALW